jgi:protein-L-isoaspartate(D-aspartate) O-methyltransferase
VADWVDRQLVARGIRDERVLAAMRAVPRERFVPAQSRAHAYDDDALLLGYGQTISQPYIVALICEALSLRGDERVLDVGTGSGYQAAVLAALARSVVSIERIPELADLARDNLAGTGVEIVVGDGTRGYRKRAPFDAIAVAASASELPRALVDQLSPRGRIVIPLGETLVRVDAIAPARFVPLVSGK